MGMYNNLFNVNDSEVKRILEMHKNATRNQYLIVEESPNPKTLAVNYGNLFPQGKYLVKGEIADKIDTEINKIENYRMGNGHPEVKVFIESSESKIPNYDREKYPLTGSKTDYSKEKSLPPGKLSELRAKNLSDYLKASLALGAEVIVKDLGAQGPEWTHHTIIRTQNISLISTLKCMQHLQMETQFRLMPQNPNLIFVIQH